MQALDGLLRRHYQHKNGTELHFGPQFLPLVAKLLDEDFMLFEAARDGRPVGMLGVVRSGPVAWSAWFGIWPDRSPQRLHVHEPGLLPACGINPAALGLQTILYGTLAWTQSVDADARSSATACSIARIDRRCGRAGESYFAIHRAWFGRKLG